MSNKNSLAKKEKLEAFSDIPLKLDVEVGRTKMSIKDVLELDEGSVIEIQKSAGDNMEININDIPLALGEIFVIENSIGIRITEVVSDENEY